MQPETHFKVNVYPVIRTAMTMDGDTSPEMAASQAEETIARELCEAGEFTLGGRTFDFAEDFSGAVVDVIEDGERVGDGIDLPRDPALVAQAKEYAQRWNH